jgi:hypothetical protein
MRRRTDNLANDHGLRTLRRTPASRPQEHGRTELLKRKIALAFILTILTVLVYLNIERPSPSPDQTTSSTDRARVETDNWNLNHNKTLVATTVCYTSSRISTTNLNLHISYNFIVGKPWNATTGPDGCYTFQGVPGVSYVSDVFYSFPSQGSVHTAVGVMAGQRLSLSLDSFE